MLIDQHLVAARERWPNVPDDVLIIITTAQAVRIPVMEEKRVEWDRNLAWDFALADMTLHPEFYTLECKMEIRRKTSPRFGMVEIRLEDIGDFRLGYDSDLNILCVGEKQC